MKKLAMLLAMVISTSALAEEPKPEATKDVRPPRIDFYLKLSADDLQTLNAALIELPKRVADPFIAKLNGQLAPQTQQANEAAAKAGGSK